MQFLFLVLTVSMLLWSRDSGAQDQARYRLDIEISWSAETHPLAFPQSAHLSGLIGVTHSSRYTLFADGLTATSGLELLAENGRASILEAEMAEAARRGRVGEPFTAKGLSSLPGEMSTEFAVGSERSLVSFATMIAPSPDWFTGASGIELAPGGAWAQRIEAPLWAWDAGTDSGEAYDAADDDTQPRQSVRLLATPHFLSEAGLLAVGHVILTRLE